MKNRWGKLAGQLGIAYFLAGLFLVFLGWNGAATYDRVSAQVPYLISGGLAGLCLVVIGGSVLVAASAREGAAALEATVADLQEVVERMAAGAGTQGSGRTTVVGLDRGAEEGSGGTTGVRLDSSGGQGTGSASGGGAVSAAGQRTVTDTGPATTFGDDAVVTGPTLTNVNDVRAILVTPGS